MPAEGEYTGKTRRNTLPARPKDPKSLPITPQRALRLLYLTGQMTDPTIDPSFRPFQGWDPRARVKGFKELYGPEAAGVSVIPRRPNPPPSVEPPPDLETSQPGDVIWAALYQSGTDAASHTIPIPMPALGNTLIAVTHSHSVSSVTGFTSLYAYVDSTDIRVSSKTADGSETQVVVVPGVVCDCAAVVMEVFGLGSYGFAQVSSHGKSVSYDHVTPNLPILGTAQPTSPPEFVVVASLALGGGAGFFPPSGLWSNTDWTAGYTRQGDCQSSSGGTYGVVGIGLATGVVSAIACTRTFTTAESPNEVLDLRAGWLLSS